MPKGRRVELTKEAADRVRKAEESNYGAWNREGWFRARKRREDEKERRKLYAKWAEADKKFERSGGRRGEFDSSMRIGEAYRRLTTDGKPKKKTIKTKRHDEESGRGGFKHGGRVTRPIDGRATKGLTRASRRI